MKTKRQLIQFLGRMDAIMNDIPDDWESARRERRIVRIIHTEDAATVKLIEADFEAASVLRTFKFERDCEQQQRLSKSIDRGLDKLDAFLADIDRRVAKLHG